MTQSCCSRDRLGDIVFSIDYFYSVAGVLLEFHPTCAIVEVGEFDNGWAEEEHEDGGHEAEYGREEQFERSGIGFLLSTLVQGGTHVIAVSAKSFGDAGTHLFGLK